MKVLCSILTRLLGNTEAKHLTGRPLFEFSIFIILYRDTLRLRERRGNLAVRRK
jgi:hypothetical protein